MRRGLTAMSQTLFSSIEALSFFDNWDGLSLVKMIGKSLRSILQAI